MSVAVIIISLTKMPALVGFQLNLLNRCVQIASCLLKQYWFPIQAAFNGNTLGLPKLCPEENITLLNRDVLDHYVHRYYRPDRITIAGANVNHNELVKYCEKHFNEKQLDWYSADKFDPPDRSVAQYTGGILKVCLLCNIGHIIQRKLLKWHI